MEYKIGTNMNLFCRTLVPLLLFPAVICSAQASKPVLSAQPSQPTTAPPEKPAAPMVPDSPNYVIGPEDNIKVTVWNNANLSGDLPVRPDGRVTLPLIGDVQAAGFTASRLADDIAAKLRKYVTDPVVNVSVLAVNSKRIYVMGEVMKAGPMPMTPDMTVLQAIASAGGPTPYANEKKVYILRGESGKQQTIHFDYKKALKKGDMQGVSLMPGDTIVVP